MPTQTILVQLRTATIISPKLFILSRFRLYTTFVSPCPTPPNLVRSDIILLMEWRALWLICKINSVALYSLYSMCAAPRESRRTGPVPVPVVFKCEHLGLFFFFSLHSPTVQPLTFPPSIYNPFTISHKLLGSWIHIRASDINKGSKMITVRPEETP